jgi:hypothetical protein
MCEARRTDSYLWRRSLVLNRGREACQRPAARIRPRGSRACTGQGETCYSASREERVRGGSDPRAHRRSKRTRRFSTVTRAGLGGPVSCWLARERPGDCGHAQTWAQRRQIDRLNVVRGVGCVALFDRKPRCSWLRRRVRRWRYHKMQRVGH